MVEGPVETFVGPDGTGMVHLRVEAGMRAVICPSRFPWRIGVPSSDQLDAARKSRETGVLLARERARESDQPLSWIRGAEGEPALSVRLSQRCNHVEVSWKKKSCGHVWCAMCNGFVHPVSRVALSGPGPVISCNRKPNGLEDYEHWFAENHGGTVVLTHAMKGVVPEGRVREARNLQKSGLWDVMDNRGFERLKKEAKGRTCAVTHYSPVAVWLGVVASPPVRGKDGRELDRDVEVKKLLTRYCALCRIHHEVGDGFSLLQPYPTPLLGLPGGRALLDLPDVFVLTFDRCEFGGASRDRQCVITNQPWLA